MASMLNEHYTNISTDKQYVPACRKDSVNHSTQPNDEYPFTECRVFHLLDNLRSTATGLDELPAWFLRLGAPILAKPITSLFNQSINCLIVPVQWKRVYIHPVNKIAEPKMPADFRPISITPVLSRMMEKMIVQTFIYPALLCPPPALCFMDQFAFRPTGSTTAAIISLLHTVTNLLASNQYVIVYCLDFSKTFDTVRHSTLMEKIAMLQLPDWVYNWMVDFFEHRTYRVVYNEEWSAFLEILASIIQGSGIGPASYVVNAGDLRTKNPQNKLVKFADDTYLIVPPSMEETRIEEISNISKWAMRNNLTLNNSKTVEIIFSRPRSRRAITPPALIPGIVRSESMKMLGVTISKTFSVSQHIDETVSTSACALFALRTLRAHGLNEAGLDHVFKSLILSRLLYTSPAWWGFTKASDRDRLEGVLRRSIRSGFCSENSPTFAALCEKSDNDLFSQIRSNEAHVLYGLLQSKPACVYTQRE